MWFLEYLYPGTFYQAKKVEYFNQDDELISVEENDYDDSGYNTKEVVSDYASASKELIKTSTTEWTRNAKGRVLTGKKYEYKSDGTEYLATLDTNTYKDLEIHEVLETIDYNEDGSQKTKVTSAHDEFSREIEEKTEDDGEITIVTTEREDDRFLSSNTKTTTVDGEKTETDVFDRDACKTITTSFEEDKTGKQTGEETCFNSDNLWLIKSSSATTTTRSSERECTLEGKVYACTKTTKVNEKITEKVVEESIYISVFLRFAPYEVNFPATYDTSVVTTTYDSEGEASEIVTETTVYNSTMKPTSIVKETLNVKTGEKVIDEAVTTYEDDKRPLKRTVTRLEGSGTPSGNNVVYTY